MDQERWITVVFSYHPNRVVTEYLLVRQEGILTFPKRRIIESQSIEQVFSGLVSDYFGGTLSDNGRCISKGEVLYSDFDGKGKKTATVLLREVGDSGKSRLRPPYGDHREIFWKSKPKSEELDHLADEVLRHLASASPR